MLGKTPRPPEAALPGMLEGRLSRFAVRGMSRDLWLDLALGVGVLAARVPFLFSGYGTDADAWRVVWAGHEIARTGLYRSSRAPGYPIPEYLAALLNGAPAWSMNAVSALAGAVAVLMFGRLLRRLGCRAWLAGAIAFGFTPVVAIHSADAMDYMWAAAFIMSAWYAAVVGRFALAGALIGVATGCRPTSAIMLIPLSVVAVGHRGPADKYRLRHLIALWVGGGVASLIAFAPVWASSGLRWMHAYAHGYPRPLYVIKNASIDVWGVLGSLLVAGALLRAGLRFRRASEGACLPSARKDVLLAAAIAVGVVYGLFLALPHDAGYLIPAVPFMLLLLARTLSPRWLGALAVGLVASSFFVKVSEPGKPGSRDNCPTCFQVRLAGASYVIDFARGPVVVEEQRRRALVRQSLAIIAAVHGLKRPSVVVAHEWLPVLRVLGAVGNPGSVTYVYGPRRTEIDSLRRDGQDLYDLPGADDYTRTWFGYSLRAVGSRPLGAP